MTNELRKHFSHLWVRVKGKLTILNWLQMILNIFHTSLTFWGGYQPSNKHRRRSLLSQKTWHLRLFTPTKAASVRRQHSIATPLSRHVISKGNKGRQGAGRCPSTARRHLSDISPVLWASSNGNKTGQEQTKLEQYSIRGPSDNCHTSDSNSHSDSESDSDLDSDWAFQRLEGCWRLLALASFGANQMH